MSDRNRNAQRKSLAASPKLDAAKQQKPDQQPADPAPAEQLAGTTEEPKRKIQANREEKNGVKRPSAGGKCAQVWDYCDSVLLASNAPPSAEMVKKEAEARGWNATNASIELYAWRKFQGIRGRVATAQVPAAAEATEAK